jgi:tetratricopeptide (TPR) repeat protein
MYKRYFFLVTVFAGLNLCVAAQTAQTAPGKPAVTYSGPSAAGDAKRDAGDFKGAIVEYTNEINKIDAEAQRIVKLKADYAKMSEFDKMNQDQEAIKKNYSDWAKLYYGRAISNITLMTKTTAKADLDMAIGLDNSNGDAYYQRALLINSKENRDNACKDLTQAMALGSEKAKLAHEENFCWNAAQVHYKEGASRVTTRKYEDAIVELDLAILICPDSGVYYAKRGQAYLGLKKNTQAVEDFTKATELSPTNPDGYYQLGLYYFNQDDFDKAFDYLTKAITRAPMNYDAYIYRAQCCERQNKQTSAIYDYGQAISLRPSDPEAYYRRALLEREMKETGKACKDFAKASQLGNEDANEFLKECTK